MVNTISSYNFWREYGHPYLPQRKSSHRVEGEVTTCNQSIRDFLLLLICRCSALSYCQFWISWLWNFKLGFIIFFCHVLANCLDTNQCYSWVYTSYHFNAMSGKFGKFKERRGIKFLKQYFLKTQRAIFQTYWKVHCVTKSLFIELETSNVGTQLIFQFCWAVESFSKIGRHWY